MKKYDFKNEQDFKECEQLAFTGTLDFSKFPPAAYRYFSELSKLYAEYRRKEISKSDAETNKKKLYANYIEALSAYEKWCDTCKAYQDSIRQTDVIRCNICKSDSIYDIADMAVKALSLLTDDTVVYKIFKNKFKEG